MSDLQFSDYRIDRSRRQLRRGEELIPLPAKAFDLLSYMAANPGRPLSKAELLSSVWPDSFVEESNLTQNVFTLRRVLKPGAEDAILTIPGRGYQFTTEVVEVPHDELLRKSSPLAAATELVLNATQSRLVYEEETEERISFRDSPLALGALSLGVLAIAVAGWLGWQRWEDHVGGPPVQVVLADLEGGTGDLVLDHTLNNVVRMELAQSPFVNIVSAATAQKTLLQMMHKPDELLTASLAREVCERTASQAVLNGTVARTGSGFLFTEQAISCVDGSILASSSQSAASADHLPQIVNKAVVQIRRGLGESRRTIAHFDMPLQPAMTGSLDALKDYTQAATVGEHGNYPEAIELLKQAVALDPKFAAAYMNLSLYSTATLANDDAVRYLQKAYDLREFATEPARRFIVARYHSLITQDLYESLRNYQAWADLYPRSPQPWSGLQNVNVELGRWKDALVAAHRAVLLVPDNASGLHSLADTQIRNGDLADAEATCDLMLAHHFDGDSLRYLLLRLGHLQHRADVVQAQGSWLKLHPDSPTLLGNEAELALQEGRFADAEDYLRQMTTAFAAHGQATAATALRQRFAYVYAGLGELATARTLLHLGPVGQTEEELVTLVDVGEGPAADALLKQALTAHPQSTEMLQMNLPLVRSKEALASGHPAQAVQELEPARSFGGAGNEVLYVRGQAYMKAHQLPQAEAEFRAVLLHPEIDPFSWQLPMAELQLARVLAMEGRKPEAIAAYRSFLESWSHADASAAALQQAKSELSALEGQP